MVQKCKKAIFAEQEMASRIGGIYMSPHGVRSPNPTRRKIMSDRLILTILIALACPLLLPIVIDDEVEGEV